MFEYGFSDHEVIHVASIIEALSAKGIDLIVR
jgi:hypothetical protein